MGKFPWCQSSNEVSQDASSQLPLTHLCIHRNWGYSIEEEANLGLLSKSFLDVWFGNKGSDPNNFVYIQIYIFCVYTIYIFCIYTYIYGFLFLNIPPPSIHCFQPSFNILVSLVFRILRGHLHKQSLPSSFKNKCYSLKKLTLKTIVKSVLSLFEIRQ